MTVLAPETIRADLDPPQGLWRKSLKNVRVAIGGTILLIIFLICLATLPWTLRSSSSLYYDQQNPSLPLTPPDRHSLYQFFGTDLLGHSLLGRSLIGGAISLSIGIAAAAIAAAAGVSVGLLAGYRGGWLDSLLMRSVDILYGLPYILLIILLKIALEHPLEALVGKLQWGTTHWITTTMAGNLIVLFLAIGLVSWLTMARVVRGQVLSLRAQPFIEACKAMGLKERRIFLRHLLPNLVGPVVVYATLTVPSAILQESFLSFLGNRDSTADADVGEFGQRRVEPGAQSGE